MNKNPIRKCSKKINPFSENNPNKMVVISLLQIWRKNKDAHNFDIRLKKTQRSSIRFHVYYLKGEENRLFF